MTRSATAQELYRLMVQEVEAIAPKGIGGWDPAWERTHETGEKVCDAISAWKTSGSPVDEARVQVAHQDFLDSWRRVARQFNELQGKEHGPVTIVEDRGNDPGFAVPDEPGSTAVEIDPDRVQTITKATEAASRILEEALIDRDGEEAEGISGDPESMEGPHALDEKHRALVDALTRCDSWSAVELAEVADEHGLLGAGAVEVINEAAFEICDEPLLEGSDPIEINSFALEAMELR